MAIIRIQDIARHVGQQVTLQGWLYNKTDKGKLQFLQVRDGTGIVQAVVLLDKFLPGVAEDSTLIYAPEIKFYSLKLKVDQGMRTNIPYIYAIGDGAGMSRGIVGAAVTGLVAGENIISNNQI